MGTLARTVPENATLRRFGGDLLPATLGQSLAAVFGDPTLSPAELLLTQAEIQRETAATRRFVGAGRVRRSVPFEDPDPELSPIEDTETLNARFGHLGLTFDKPTRRRVAEILAEQKRAERIRRDVLARGPRGAGAGTLQLGAGFVRALLDPVNVAAAFVPVVSQARFAGLAVRLGRTGARFTRGVLEGAAGNAAIEPFVAGLSRQQQLDYTMADALLNIALGGLIGGGLHTGGGAIADFVAARRPETREAALQTAVAQAAEGRRVEVDPVIRAERDALGTAFDEVLERPLGSIDDPLVRLRPGVLEEVLVERGPAFERGGEIVVRGRELKRLFGTRPGFGLVKIIFRHGPRSGKTPAVQVTREDLLALPQILRDFEPSRVNFAEDGSLRAADFRVTLPNARFGPREVVFGIRKFTDTDGENRLVTAFVVEPGRHSPVPPSQKRTGAAGSPDTGFKPGGGDTAPRRFDPRQGGRAAPAAGSVAGRQTRRQQLLGGTARLPAPLGVEISEPALRATHDLFLNAEAELPVRDALDVPTGQRVRVVFPDQAHRELFDFAEARAEGRLDQAEAERRAGVLFETFRGFVEDDPEVAPFNRVGDVESLAEDFREEVLDEMRTAARAKREAAPSSVVDPDFQAAFIRSELGRRAALPDGTALVAREAARVNGERLAERAGREEAPERDATADFEAEARIAAEAAAAERLAGEEAQLELDFAREQVDQLKAQGLLSKAEETALEEIAEAAAQATAAGKAARAAAFCLGRQG